jgi:hypothetical protein
VSAVTNFGKEGVVRIIIASLAIGTLLVGPLAVAGCGESNKMSVGDTSPEEAARRERERPRIVAPAEPQRLPVVPGKGTCAPPADNIVILGSCCNDTACAGQCVTVAEGKVECSCFGVRGGCAAGTVCCKFRHRCVPAKECQLP